MNVRHLFSSNSHAIGMLAVLGASLALTAPLGAAGPKKNPTSKIYVADVDGDAQIDTGDRVDDLNKKSVYNAEGTVIETKPHAANAMVFSNGTGIFFDEDTRVEVKKFEQEPFSPNRTDADVEPSVSQTHAYVPRGTVGLCTSKLVAGSNMTYQTPEGAVNIRGGKMVIQAEKGTTTISNIEGDSTVNTGNVNLGGKTLKNGEQAVIRDRGPGQAADVKIQPIPDKDKPQLSAKAAMACTAKKTVYFEVKTSIVNTPTLPGATVSAKATTNTSSSETTTDTPVTAFDGDTGNATPTATAPAATNNSTQQIVAQPAVSTDLPVQYTVSPASLTASAPATTSSPGP